MSNKFFKIENKICKASKNGSCSYIHFCNCCIIYFASPFILQWNLDLGTTYSVTNRDLVTLFWMTSFLLSKIHTGSAIKNWTHSFNQTCSHDRNPFNFKTKFICFYIELSFEVHNSFLGPLA